MPAPTLLAVAARHGTVAAMRPDRAPLLTVVVPTRDRPHLLPQAVEGALAQTVDDLEVVVVDDGSVEPVTLPAHPRVRVVRLDRSRGNAGARNAGLAAARSRWLACLDDDDVLLPHFAETSLAALEGAGDTGPLPPPVAVTSGVAEVDEDGRELGRRLPPTLPRGAHYSLEPLPPGRSYNAKQTLVVETSVLRAIGGWDESFRSRTVTELFLRLNPVCSILGLDEVTYRLREHRGSRLSRDPALRQASFAQLVAKHRALFDTHPRRYAELLLDHALMSLHVGQVGHGMAAIARAARRAPTAPLRRGRQLAGATLRGVAGRR
jgi:hypothetical protein